MTAPKEVLDLVERFARGRDAYRSPAYDETQLRREYLDPFFPALGWDVGNRAGWAEPYKEVIHEDAIKIGAFMYIYPKALGVMPLPKLFTPDIAELASFSLDETGEVFFTGGAAGGYGILVRPELSREYILTDEEIRIVEEGYSEKLRSP